MTGKIRLQKQFIKSAARRAETNTKTKQKQEHEEALESLCTVARRKVGKPIVVCVSTTQRVEARHLLAFRNRAGVADVRVQEAARVVML
jgi:hypothetical protein